MFKLLTRSEEQIFDTKDQAIEFYERGSLETAGAESDRYAAYADEMRASDDATVARYMFSGVVRRSFKYDADRKSVV